jgi:hypothetical protein
LTGCSSLLRWLSPYFLKEQSTQPNASEERPEIISAAKTGIAIIGIIIRVIVRVKVRVKVRVILRIIVRIHKMPPFIWFLKLRMITEVIMFYIITLFSLLLYAFRQNC